jgi:predicted nucleic-acid-binding Zn-ribbon protein
MNKCPKCGSTDIDKGELVRSGKAKGSLGYWSHTKKGFLPRGGAFESYVCLNCGYLELYFVDLNKLK